MAASGRTAEVRYRVVDVFTSSPLEGNALAVFPDASAFDANTMQRIALELNLAETAFVLPPTRRDCVAQVRIFTPRKEMRFAGHPTIGTAYVLLDEGMVDAKCGSIFVEELVGPVGVRIEAAEPPMLWLTTPQIEWGTRYDRGLCASALGLQEEDVLDIAPQWLSAGNPTVFVPLRSKETVDRVCLDMAAMRPMRGAGHDPMCVFVFAPTQYGAYSRMFAPEYGIAEDPATGSSTGPLAAYMMHHHLIANTGGTRFVSEQGTKMGRRSLLHVHIKGESGREGIEVGGQVTPIATASMRLPL